MKILVFYVDKQYFNMVILFLRLRVRRELIIRRDGRAVEGTGLENRRRLTPFVSSNLTASANHADFANLLENTESPYSRK